MPTPYEEAAFGERWPSVNATGTNAIATATKAGVAGKRHVVTGLTITASAAVAAAVEATLEVKGGIAERIEIPAAALQPIVMNFVPPYICDDGQKAEAILPALGAAVKGSVTMRGYSVSI